MQSSKNFSYTILKTLLLLMMPLASCQSPYMDYAGRAGDYFPAQSVFTLDVPESLALSPQQSTVLELPIVAVEHDGISGLTASATAHVASSDQGTKERYAFVEVHAIKSSSAEVAAVGLASLPSGKTAIPLKCLNNDCSSYALEPKQLLLVIEDNVALEGVSFKLAKGIIKTVQK